MTIDFMHLFTSHMNGDADYEDNRLKKCFQRRLKAELVKQRGAPDLVFSQASKKCGTSHTQRKLYKRHFKRNTAQDIKHITIKNRGKF